MRILTYSNSLLQMTKSVECISTSSLLPKKLQEISKEATFSVTRHKATQIDDFQTQKMIDLTQVSPHFSLVGFGLFGFYWLYLDCSEGRNMKVNRVLSEEPRSQRMFFMVKKNTFKKDVNRHPAFSPQNRYNPNAFTKAITNCLDIPDSKRSVNGPTRLRILKI